MNQLKMKKTGLLIVMSACCVLALTNRAEAKGFTSRQTWDKDLKQVVLKDANQMSPPRPQLPAPENSLPQDPLDVLDGKLLSADDMDPLLDPDDLMGREGLDALRLKNVDILEVLKLLSQKGNINIIAGKGIQGNVSIYLTNVKLRDALRIILDSNDLAYKVEDGIVRVMTAKEFESRYGMKFGGLLQTRIVPLQNTVVTDVIPVLEQVKSSKGKIITDLKSNSLVLIDSPDNLAVMKRLITEMDIPVTTKVFDLTYAKVKDISDKVQELLTEKIGQLRADERSNKIIVTDTGMKLERIAEYIQAVDVKEPQVLIEAKIIQVILSDEQKFGVDWTGLVSKHHDLQFVGDFDILSSNEKRGTMSIGTLATDDYAILLDALESVGESNILSSPRISALNNQEAKILVGSTEPYVTSTTTVSAAGPTTTTESVNFIEVGVKLYVTPTIHRDGFITMKIKPEVSSVTSTVTTSNNNTIPVVDTSEAETTVTVKNGVTIIIGGLIKEEEILATKKVPLLGDVPVLGYAFRSKSNLTRKTEVVIFLTPRIVTGDIVKN